MNLLDCTMRDGGYYNDWTFSRSFATDYLELLENLGMSHAELGFRFLRSKSHSGPWAYTPDSLIDSYSAPSSLKVGVMVNLGEFADVSRESISSMFPNSGCLDFVRIACHYDELGLLPDLVESLIDKGIEIGVNLMQVSERSEGDLEYFSKVINECGANFAYIADSLGSLRPKQTLAMSEILCASLTVPFGIHAHDNRGLALQNTLSAKNGGATMLDSTMGGIGRGAGNTKTEDLLAELSAHGEINMNAEAFVFLGDFLYKHILPLKEKYKWGSSLAYRLAADWAIHPSFVQEFESQAPGSPKTIISLQSLAKVDSSRYDPSLLEQDDDHEELVGHVSKTLIASSGKDVLIVGAGLSALDNAEEIELFAQNRQCAFYLLNMAWAGRDSSNAVFRLAGNKSRLEINEYEFWNSHNSLVTPHPQPVKTTRPVDNSVIQKRLSPQSLGAEGSTLLVPNDLSLSYALALAISQSAQNVFLAGIDGYTTDDVRNSDIIQTLSLFQSQHPNIGLISLTPTRFPVVTESPFWRG